MIETIAIILTGLGLTASLFYYATVIQNANKTQQMQLETRQAQFFMQYANEFHTPENLSFWVELVRYEWEDIADFERKYGSVDHPDAFGKRYSFWARLNDLGWLVEKGIVDIADVNALMNQLAIWTWEKFEQIIYERRIIYNLPDEMIYWERLVQNIMEYRKRENILTETPEFYDDYLSTVKDNP